MWLFRQKTTGTSAAEKIADRRDLMPDVVIVEDSEAVQNILTLVAEKAGMSTACATSLDQVKALDLRDATSLVLLDLSLDRSDAIDVLTYLESVTFAGAVVLMSGQDTTVLNYIASVGQQKGLRMLAPLKKPFKVETLRKILAEHNRGDATPTTFDFKEALKAGQVEIWYQPRVHFAAFDAYGFEAMVRVKHPRLGLITPARFQNRLTAGGAAAMGAHLLQEAIETWKRLLGMGLILKPSVTMRAQDLLDPCLLDVLRTHRPNDLRWSGLIIKLTEPKLLGENQAIREAIVRLQLHNVQFALADLAQVADVLTCLPEIRLSEILVSENYTNGCCRNGERKQLCTHATQLARRLKLSVVAEDIDRLEDLKTLRQLGFDGGQGNLFEAAMPYPAFESLVEKRKPLLAAARIGTAA